ncbi:hypothetical protein V1477_000239 [Vespula maculifrons]|uniref:Uncharacterized protein n=1 Tax=Vespula maculifrons TaxID=7453 RepID=A0ABD2D1A6_VESMC
MKSLLRKDRSEDIERILPVGYSQYAKHEGVRGDMLEFARTFTVGYREVNWRMISASWQATPVVCTTCLLRVTRNNVVHGVSDEVDRSSGLFPEAKVEHEMETLWIPSAKVLTPRSTAAMFRGNDNRSCISRLRKDKDALKVLMAYVQNVEMHMSEMIFVKVKSKE